MSKRGRRPRKPLTSLPSASLPDPPAEALLLTVRVDIDEAKPPVWRRLALRGDMTAGDLHDVLQSVFGWEYAHLHRFWIGPTKQIYRGPYLSTDEDEDDQFDILHRRGPVAHEDEVRLDQLLTAPADRLFYTYDFGDDWHHTIAVEHVRGATAADPQATCLGGRNAGPVEDVGGLWAHNALVAAHRAGEQFPEPYDEWMPPGWDPAAFDVERTNSALRRLFGHA